MKYLKTFNESVYGDLRRLNPKNKIDDEKGIKLIDEIIEDYEIHNRDLKKVRIIDNGGNEISFSRIEVGNYYTFMYIFGEFHLINNSNKSGNMEVGNRYIKITTTPFQVVLKRDSLEKTFNTSRFSMKSVNIVDKKIEHNYDRNPNIGNHALYNEKIDRYKVSPDIVKELFIFFFEEYNTKYPELKNATNRDSDSIRALERGDKPIIKFITAKSKDGENISSVPIYYGDNEKEVRNFVKTMTVKEYDEYRDGIRKKAQEEYYNELNKFKESFKTKFNDIFNKYLPNIKYEISHVLKDIEFYLMTGYCYKNENFENKMKNLKINGYFVKKINQGEHYKESDDRIYYAIQFVKD